MNLRRLSAAIVVLALFAVGLSAGPAGAHDPDGARCDAETEAVLGDAADWAAVELAGWVLGTKCLLDSGDRERSTLPSATRASYDGQRVTVIGGTAAVPASKLSGLSVSERLSGADRLETMRAVVAWADRIQAAQAAMDVGETGLAVTAEQASGYARDKFGDHNSSLCSTQTRGWYTGLSLSEHGCDVDHVVSLKEAWESGAHAWTASQRARFASDPANLRASLSCVNRSKGDKDAGSWPVAVASGDCEGLTPTRGACSQFTTVTVAVKRTWGLSVDAAEDAALNSQSRCKNLPETVTHPNDTAANRGNEDEDEDDEPIRTGSCTHWHAGAPKHTHVRYSDGTVSGHRHQPSSSTKCGYLWR
ncbi:GmrSD restriction endonuclease domain-containing protein [Candidatus Poriferisodalis sp.]|uniref:GmrSD restriction endonuclease domain-containing protein n=1 Tax=Candidatus Poriferisodalis sp. TaxID=3101277 RepID=UPI003B029DA0